MKPWMTCRSTLLVCVVMVSLVAGCQVYEDSEDCDPALGEQWYQVGRSSTARIPQTQTRGLMGADRGTDGKKC